MKNPEIESLTIIRYHANSEQTVEDVVAVEEPLEISLRYTENGIQTQQNISITMRTPGADRELALGFLFTEGIITDRGDVQEIVQNGSNEICVCLHPDRAVDLAKIERHFYTSSSCGVCGKSSIDSVRTVSSGTRSTTTFKVNKEVILSLNPQIKKHQAVFESTGGLHASSLFDAHGNFIDLMEDVGRHNALDKLIGKQLLKGEFAIEKHVLLLSGRASFELIQKAAMAKIPVVCALGAPSSLAIQLAREFNMTLIGFLKEQSFNVYSGELLA